MNKSFTRLSYTYDTCGDCCEAKTVEITLIECVAYLIGRDLCERFVTRN